MKAVEFGICAFSSLEISFDLIWNRFNELVFKQFVKDFCEMLEK